MKAAKDAVLSYALTYSPSGIARPGRFPCGEDTSLIGGITEGQTATSCSTSYIPRRLAWKSLNLGDLRDGNQDKLWYALSPAFNNSASIINSETTPTLGINGEANSAIAIIFSPGNALSGQSRPIPTSSSSPAVASYLEGANTDGDANFVTDTATSNFNDQLIAIEPDDFFPLLEKRVLKEIKNYLTTYKTQWGAYPFPATFSNPSTATYIGNTSYTGGLLPVGDPGTSTTTQWQSASWTSTGIPSSGTCTLVAVSGVANQRVNCDVIVAASPQQVTVTAHVNNVGLGFYKTMSYTNTSDIRITTLLGTASIVSGSRNLTHTLTANGGADLVFQGTTSGIGTVRIQFRRVPQRDDWNTTASIANYIYQNNWHNLVYYKVASPFLPGGSATCGACLNLSKTFSAPASTQTQTDIHALLISAGRKLDTTETRPAPIYSVSNPAQSRPSAALADYYDSANNISAGTAFDSKQFPLSNFNDQVEVIE